MNQAKQATDEFSKERLKHCERMKSVLQTQLQEKEAEIQSLLHLQKVNTEFDTTAHIDEEIGPFKGSFYEQSSKRDLDPATVSTYIQVFVILLLFIAASFVFTESSLILIGGWPPDVEPREGLLFLFFIGSSAILGMMIDSRRSISHKIERIRRSCC
jgi:hypothetical protein